MFPAKYRKKVFTKEVYRTLIEIYLEISKRFEVNLFEIGNDEDHVHFLVQSVPKIPVSRIVQIVKSITAREKSLKHKKIKKILWGEIYEQAGFMQNMKTEINFQKVFTQLVLQTHHIVY